MMNTETLMEEQDKDWTLVIKPQSSLFDLQLKEVWRYRDLLFLFVKRDFVAAYKQTILGPLWHFIQPIFTTIVFLVVFGKIAKIPTDGIEPILFYMSGITIWNYFANCLNATSGTFIANAGIFGKVYFPRLIIPLSTIVSNIIKFGIQFLLLTVISSYLAIVGKSAIVLSWNLLLIPFLVIMMAAIGLGLGIIISSVTTKYRDLTVLIGFAVQLLMYCTPVVYPLSYFANSSYKWFIIWNPLTPVVEAFRFSLFFQGTFTIDSLLYSFSFAIIVLFVGLLLFNKVERTFMDTV